MHILHYVAIILILVGYFRCTIFIYIVYQQIRKIIGLKWAIINNLMMTFQILQRHFYNFFGRNINMYLNNVSNFNVNVCQKILILYKIIPSQVWFPVSHFFPGTQLITFLFPTLMSPGEQPYVIDGGMYVLFTMIRFSVGGSGSLQTAEHTKK